MTTRRACEALLLGALFMAGCEKKLGPDQAAKAFFDQLAAGKVDEAYDSAAFGFQVQKPRKFFVAMVKEMGLADIASATFATPQKEGRTAIVRGEFATKAGTSFALIVTLTQDAGAWRVYALKSPRETGGAQDRFRVTGRPIGLTNATNHQPAPDDAAFRKLIVEALTSLGGAVQAKSFDDFFDHISHRWQLQLVHGDEPGFDYETAMRGDLKAGERELGSAYFVRAFRPFFERPAVLAGLADIAPVLVEQPRFSTDGLLLASGYFPTQPYRVNFALKFIYEPPMWRLFGLDVTFGDPPAAPR